MFQAFLPNNPKSSLSTATVLHEEIQWVYLKEHNNQKKKWKTEPKAEGFSSDGYTATPLNLWYNDTLLSSHMLFLLSGGVKVLHTS